MSSDLAISVNHLSKVYDLGLSGRTASIPAALRRRLRHPVRGGEERERFYALDDVSFDIDQGDVVGVIGNNGAGKSTLLKILSRITPPSSGYVDLVGTVGSLLEVGTGFHPELTGLENVYLNGTILGMSKRSIDRRLEEILSFAEVDKFLETPVKRYSSGMRVRLAFAVAAHLDPEILIIDEVLSVGDFGFQAKCLDRMRSISTHEGRTVLYVSHNLPTVENLCARSLLLLEGKVAFDGPTKETISRYLDRFPHAVPGAVPGTFDLAVADRSSGYEKVFTHLAFGPSGGPPSTTVRAGERVHIEITVEGMDAIKEPFIGVTLGTSSTPTLFRMTSRMQAMAMSQKRTSREKIVLDVPSLPLTPGDYTMTLILKDDHGTTIDYVRDAADFSVVSGDFFGNGYRFDQNDGYFTIPWEWELRSATAKVPATPKDTGASRSRR